MLHTLFGFSGRTARLRFFACFTLAVAAPGALLVLGFLAIIYGFGALFVFFPFAHGGDVVLYSLFWLIAAATPLMLLIAWICLALMVKRLHDFDRSGWHVIWLSLLFIVGSDTAQSEPLFGLALLAASFVAYAWLLLAPGNAGANAYGPQPT